MSNVHGVTTGQAINQPGGLDCALCGKSHVTDGMECTYVVDHNGNWCGKWVCEGCTYLHPVDGLGVWGNDHKPDERQGMMF